MERKFNGSTGKRAIIVLLLFTIFAVQMANAVRVSAYSATETALNLDKENDLMAKERDSEELRVVIGVPSTVDTDDPIPVVVAGFRDAKATYVKPLWVKINMYVIDPTASETDNDKESLVSSREGWYYENQWIYNNESSSITRLNDYIYQVTFPPLRSEATIKIEASMRWVSPWNEIFVSSDESYVDIGKMHNYTQYLQTDSERVKENITNGFKTDTKVSIQTLTNVSNIINDIQELLENQNLLSFIKTDDPSPLHFYLLNITSIVNGSDPNSFVGKMDNTTIYKDGMTEWQYYTTRLRQINEAFMESLKLLDRKGIPYTITMVNYTYTDTIYENTLDADPDGIPDGIGGDEDADWDDENLNDTSFEFLLEPTAWSGHPDLFHQNLNISFTAPSSTGTYSLKSLLENYDAEVLNKVLEGTSWENDHQIPTQSRLQYLNMYSGYVKLYRNDSGNLIQLVEGTDYKVDGSTSLTLLTDQSGYQLIMEVERPGGWRKSNKAVIVNLMGDLFPLLSRMYYIPRNLADPDPSTPLNEYYIDPNMEGYTPPPTLHCLILQAPDGTVNKSYIESPIDTDLTVDETNYYNITDYMFFLNGLSSGAPYWINTIFKPFARFVYDNNTQNGDSYDADWNEDDLNDYINRTIGSVEIGGERLYLPMFSLMDTAIGLTADYGGGTIFPHAVNQYDWFYKNDWGKWIDAFFNGTSLAGNDPDHYDMVNGFNNSWTFRYIDRDVSDVSDQDLPAEFQLAPFQGPSDYTPVGIMTAGSIVFAQNSLSNISAGFGYVYGLIYNLYRRTYDATKSSLLKIVNYMVNENKTDAVDLIYSDIHTLDEAWDTLNLSVIDEIHRKAVDFMRNPNNPYTASNGMSFLQNKISDAYTKINDAVNRLKKHEATANNMDNELSNTQYDVQKLGILDNVKTFLTDSVLKWLGDLNETINNKIESMTSQFIDFSNRIQDAIVQGFNNFTGEKGFLDNFTQRITEGLNTTAAKIADSSWANTARASVINAFSVIGLAVGAAANTGMIGTISFFGKTTLGEWIYGIISKLGTKVGETTYHAINRLLNAAGIKISEAIYGLSTSLGKGLDTIRVNLHEAFGKVGDALENAGTALTNAMERLSEVIQNIVNHMISAMGVIVKSMITNLQVIDDVLDNIIDIIGKITDKITDVYNNVKKVFINVGNFIANIMGQSLGRIKDIMAKVSGDVVDKLKYALDQLKNNSAFIKISQIYNKLQTALTRFASLKYKTTYGTIDQDTVLAQADAMKPLSEINSADRGFYVFQMGNAFAERLYFVVIYNGSLTSVDNIDFRIRRFSDLTEFGGSGSAIIESYPNVYKFRANESDPDSVIDGMYYVNITEGQKMTWYRENSTEPFVDAAATEGYYFTMFNCTLNNRPEWGGEDIDSYSVEKTRLYTREYINDAFPIITVAGYNPDRKEPIKIEANGNSQVFDIAIYNKMWSDPKVQVDVILSTKGDNNGLFDGGTAIAQIRYNNVPLYPEDKTSLAISMNFGRNTPSGYYYVIIAVTESNGDYTVTSIPVEVEQSNFFVNFVASLFTSGWGWGLIGVVVGLVGLGYWMLTKQKRSLISNIPKMKF